MILFIQNNFIYSALCGNLCITPSTWHCFIVVVMIIIYYQTNKVTGISKILIEITWKDFLFTFFLYFLSFFLFFFLPLDCLLSFFPQLFPFGDLYFGVQLFVAATGIGVFPEKNIIECEKENWGKKGRRQSGGRKKKRIKERKEERKKEREKENTKRKYKKKINKKSFQVISIKILEIPHILFVW